MEDDMILKRRAYDKQLDEIRAGNERRRLKATTQPEMAKVAINLLTIESAIAGAS
jgi:hypothetical protein